MPYTNLPTDTSAAEVGKETELVMLGYKIAGALMHILDADVTLDVDKGLDGRTDAVRITTPDHTVTVTPRLAYHEWPDPTPSAFNTPPPPWEWHTPLCEKQGTPYPDNAPTPSTVAEAHPTTGTASATDEDNSTRTTQ